jgi:4-amino-4-deoxy-L-arabinose transferase-like glycosyltransferase
VKRALVLILLVGAVLRVAWVAHAGTAPRFVGDPQAYLLQGETIARGHGFTNPLIDIENARRRQEHEPLLARQPSSFYPPGYPVFIAAVVWTVWHTPIPDGDLVRAVEYVQALLGVLSILLAFALARRLFNERVALVAATIMALYPNLITTTATLQLETVFITLSLATLLVLLPVATGADRSVARLVAAGAMIGVVALVRPTIGLLLLAFLVTRLLARRPWRETLVAFAVLTGAMVLIVLPWTVRNAVRLHAFVPISTGIGPALCMSRNVEATGGLDTGILERQCQPPLAGDPNAKDDGKVNTYATRRALHWVLDHPVDEVRMWFWRTDLAYSHDTSGLDEARDHMDPRWFDVAAALSDGASYMVLGFAAVGIFVLVRRKRPDGVFLLASTVAFAAVPIILFGDPRYRVPAEPLMVILAAVGVCAALAGITPFSSGEATPAVAEAEQNAGGSPLSPVG